MTRIAKLYAAIIADSNASFSYREFERLLLAFGFEHKRISGSHRIFSHPLVPHNLSIQPRGGEAKSDQLRQFLDIVTEYGLELRD
jgi:predicted RNA binding protein YcfA (HicA-like mRNA interferase family)